MPLCRFLAGRVLSPLKQGLKTCPGSLQCGMQKAHSLPEANSSPGSCRNRVSQGFRANVRLQPLINYRVALSNDELSKGKKTQKVSLAKSRDLAFLEVNQHDRSFIPTLQIYKSNESRFFRLLPPPSLPITAVLLGWLGLSWTGRTVSGSGSTSPGALVLTLETVFLFETLIVPKPNRLSGPKEVCDFLLFFNYS